MPTYEVHPDKKGKEHMTLVDRDPQTQEREIERWISRVGIAVFGMLLGFETVIFGAVIYMARTGHAPPHPYVLGVMIGMTLVGLLVSWHFSRG